MSNQTMLLVICCIFRSGGVRAIAPLDRSANDLAETEELIRKINPVTQVHSIAGNVTDYSGYCKGL
jgi:hypothetical protein